MSDDMQRTAPGVTFLTSEQKIWGDCGLGNSHNYRYLIKLVDFVSALKQLSFLLQIGTHLQCNCVPNCNKLLQIGTPLQCNCVPICNKLLQIETHLQCNCVPICNKLLQIVTYFRWYAESTGRLRRTVNFVMKLLIFFITNWHALEMHLRSHLQ